MKYKKQLAVLAALGLGLVGAGAVDAKVEAPSPTVSTLTGGIAGANGSTIGPDGALYVTESSTGQILRIDPATGATTVWASGLPTAVAPIGGPMDIVFHGNTAYVLVSLVGGFFGNAEINGIYRVDGPSDFTVIADLGQWALDNPPEGIDFFIPTGVHFAIEWGNGRFYVTDGHHNRVLAVSPSGQIESVVALPNIVPTGLDVKGHDVMLALAGPAPHLPENGKFVTVDTRNGDVDEQASGAPLLLDIERGRGHTIFGLSQGHFPDGLPDGSPADEFTGSLVMVDGDAFSTVVGGLNRPTSVEIVGDTAFVIGLDGNVTRIDGLPGPQHR